MNAPKGRSFQPFDFVPKFGGKRESPKELNARIIAALPVGVTE